MVVLDQNDFVFDQNKFILINVSLCIESHWGFVILISLAPH